MFVKLCNLAAIGSLLGLLSACGGGQDSDNTHPASTGFSFSTVEGHIGAGAAPVTGAGSSTPAQSGAASGAVGPSSQLAMIYGGGASIVGDDTTKAADTTFNPTRTSLDPMEAGLLEKMASNLLDFEKLFSLEMNRQYAERYMKEILELGVQQAYVPHPDCIDKERPECAGNPLLAPN